MSSRSVCTQRVALCRITAATPRLRCHLVWIKIHTPAVAWNLFHAEATRVGPWQRPRLRCHLVWIEIHTPAVTWNLFHVEATRVDPLAGELSYSAFSCGLKSTLRPSGGTCCTWRPRASARGNALACVVASCGLKSTLRP
jgi:hypothetical protein